MTDGASIVAVTGHILVLVIHLDLIMGVTKGTSVGLINVIVDMAQRTLAIGAVVIQREGMGERRILPIRCVLVARTARRREVIGRSAIGVAG